MNEKIRNDGTDLHEHLGTAITLDRGAISRHGFPVTGELQGEFLLHQLFDHLLEEIKWLYLINIIYKIMR